MKIYTIIALFFTACSFNISSFCNEHKSEIKIVCTAAIIPQQYELRKQQYIKTLNKLKSYGYASYVIESCQSGPTFLDSVCNHVCYTQSNDLAYINNKGMNEAISLQIGLKQFNFDPEDIIIKLTGRYSLETDEFITLIRTNPDADAFVRAWNSNDAYSGLFALRLKYFLDFLDIYINSGQPTLAFEHALGLYITKMQKIGTKIVYLPRVYSYLPVCSIFLPHRK